MSWSKSTSMGMVGQKNGEWWMVDPTSSIPFHHCRKMPSVSSRAVRVSSQRYSYGLLSWVGDPGC
jgi:hypothetical protein